MYLSLVWLPFQDIQQRDGSDGSLEGKAWCQVSVARNVGGWVVVGMVIELFILQESCLLVGGVCDRCMCQDECSETRLWSVNLNILGCQAGTW